MHYLSLTALFIVAAPAVLVAQDRINLEAELRAADPAGLARDAKRTGDARRGAVVFYQADLACTRCHTPDAAANRLGPDLTAVGGDVSDDYLIESILDPSKAIREGFESIMLKVDDHIVTGLLVAETATTIVLRDAARDYKQVSYEREELSEYGVSSLSVMPSGLVNILANKQQFLDLVRYLMEIRDGGTTRARELEPDPALYAMRPIPGYEEDIDHAGFLRDLDQAAFERGETIYQGMCINCHGTHDKEGSLPTSMKFASQAFKNGSDPHTLYQTLTRGFGMMSAQTWMVPSQKYDVIHYLREAYLRDDNPAQYFELNEAYLANLPTGTERGPEPSRTHAWDQMDYGPNQIMTLEVGKDGKNFAYKGNAIRLDSGPGGVGKGRYWMLYDYDTLRVAASWSGDEFIDWNSIHFNGNHAVHPRIVGDLHQQNPTGPGWARPSDGSFEDSRLVGRDKRMYGPLERGWAQYRGMYYHGPDTIIEYTVGTARVLEMPGVLPGADSPAFTRTFNIQGQQGELVLQVARLDEPEVQLEAVGSIATLARPHATEDTPPRQGTSIERVDFDGVTYLEVRQVAGLHVSEGDFSLTARIRTQDNGTLVALTGNQPEWLPDGLTWFVRDGRLAVDIGWVGSFVGSEQIADNDWHQVALSYRHASGEIQFHVDGRADERVGHLRRKGLLVEPVLRIGYTASNFPNPSYFKGRIEDVRFFNRALDHVELRAIASDADMSDAPAVAQWKPSELAGNQVLDLARQQRHALLHRGSNTSSVLQVPAVAIAGIEGQVQGMLWSAVDGNLRLHIPAAEDARKFTLWFGATDSREAASALADEVVIDNPARDLEPKLHGGPARWSQVLQSEAKIGAGDGPFATDVFVRPTDNPWFCRLRLTGFDFLPGADSAIVSAWDGSIWKVSGFASLPDTLGTRSAKLSWRRIGSGLFQPLGVKVLGEKVFVTCRDQIVVLHDLNGDEEIDWYECFNNDHQVTDHFHEFAMGLQSDAEENLLYAKSARHALPALVPHHGTLLRVSKDGERTEIIANGFRAANGVCLNPDGTFVVTDQEGHWNPKNRINYVRQGGFYGNMYGYHDVTDEADDAMDQPLVWITNNFDRSPGELLWVDSEKWGPLNGQLLNLSYGFGRVFVVPHEEVLDQMQGGMCALPINDFPTGIMRGRFHPEDGQLYMAGMFAWAGSQQQAGGLYRLRYTGKPVHLPVELSATKAGVRIRFSGGLDPEAAETPANYQVKVWGLKRSKNYGSPHVNEHALEVSAARLSADGYSVLIELPEIAPTWGMEIRYQLRSDAGTAFSGTIHNTIHNLK
ncbi:MAG: putative heme-binding domain-containing protein [Planctomycetota bacterium]|jgi:putative heme-binding domain-containing protein